MVPWYTVLVVVKAVMVSSNAGVGAAYALMLCFEVFFSLSLLVASV